MFSFVSHPGDPVNTEHGKHSKQCREMWGGKVKKKKKTEFLPIGISPEEAKGVNKDRKFQQDARFFGGWWQWDGTAEIDADKCINGANVY